jgi:hypothetical protein
MKMKITMKMNKKLLVLGCLLWTNLLSVSSQGLYRQSHSQQSISENTVAVREEIGGFLFESKSALTEKPTLPGDVGTPVGDGCLILLVLIGGYIVYRTKLCQKLVSSSLRGRRPKQSSLLTMIYGLLPASFLAVAMTK